MRLQVTLDRFIRTDSLVLDFDIGFVCKESSRVAFKNGFSAGNEPVFS